MPVPVELDGGDEKVLVEGGQVRVEVEGSLSLFRSYILQSGEHLSQLAGD